MPGQKGTPFPVVDIGNTRCLTGQLISVSPLDADLEARLYYDSVICYERGE
jgi:hypothetical protein